MRKLATAVFVLLAVAIVPTLAIAQCSINGNISVENSDNPLGAFRYTLDVTWDSGSPHGLSHLGILVDIVGGTCSCADFSQAITFDTISGTSDGEPGCMVEYYSELSCNGDPSIGLVGSVFKFEPFEGPCEPGPTGSGSFVFYSDLPGVPIAEQYIGIVDKAGLEFCTGLLTGVFPGMICEPVANDGYSWDSFKGLYR